MGGVTCTAPPVTSEKLLVGDKTHPDPLLQYTVLTYPTYKIYRFILRDYTRRTRLEERGVLYTE